MSAKKIIIIAGPNRAGKTTFARSFLPEEAQCPRFINADLIAAGWARHSRSGDPSSVYRWVAQPRRRLQVGGRYLGHIR